jgi:hypothetical protein
MIVTPQNSFFIRGATQSSKLTFPKMSVSLHLPGKTKPFRDYGFVISLEDEAIISAFSKDVTSYFIRGNKITDKTKVTDYKNNLDLLLEKTPFNKHNEIWVETNLIKIVGYYVVNNTTSPGYNRFIEICSRLQKYEV